MENLNDNNSKQRHGCVTAWLTLMIIANSITAITCLFAEDLILQSLPITISKSTLIVLALIGVANVIFAILLFKWSKIGFWGFLLSTLGSLIINLNIGLDVGQSMLGLAGFALLYGVLQIKKDNVSAWKNLE